MGLYGNNIIAFATLGVLIGVDEPAAVDSAETPFEDVTLLGRDFLIAQLMVDGIYQPGILNRAIKVEPKYVQDDAIVKPIVRLKTPKLQAKVPNDSANGITPEEFEAGQLISFAPRKGVAARSFSLAKIVKQTAAFVTFEIH